MYTFSFVKNKSEKQKNLHKCYAFDNIYVWTKKVNFLRLLRNSRVILQVDKQNHTHLLPAVLPKPPLSWQKPFAVMAAECGISQSLKDGFTNVSEFYNALQRIQPTDT